MSESGKWGLILIEATQRPGQVGQDDDEEVERDEDESGRTGERSNRRSRRRRPTRSERRAEGPRAGPITGVRSLVDETALITFEGGSKYSQWRFTPDVLALPSAVVGENIPNLNSRWIGRPLPEGAAPAAGGMPNQPGQQPAEQQKPQRSNRNRRRGRDG